QMRGSQQQLASMYERLDSMDRSGVDSIKSVAQIMNAIAKDGDPTSGLPAMFKDQDARVAVQSNFLTAARDIVVANKGKDPDTLTPQFQKAYEDTVNWYAKLYPASINLKGADAQSHAGVRKEQSPAPDAAPAASTPQQPPPEAEPAVPKPTPNG